MSVATNRCMVAPLLAFRIQGGKPRKPTPGHCWKRTLLCIHIYIQCIWNMTPARDPKQFLGGNRVGGTKGVIRREESWRNHGEGTLEDESWRRNRVGRIMEEESCRRDRHTFTFALETNDILFCRMLTRDHFLSKTCATNSSFHVAPIPAIQC